MTRPKRFWYALIFLATALVAAMVYPFSRGAAHRDQEQTQGLPLRELPNYDALAASTTTSDCTGETGLVARFGGAAD